MIITYVYADNNFEWNTSNWRCVIPARAINRTGKHTAHLMPLVDFQKSLKESQHLCDQSDIIVVERNFALDTLTAILRWKAKGKVVVGNFDDAYQLMPPSNSSYGYWMKGEVHYRDADGKETLTFIKPRPLDQFIWGLRILDGITVSSRLLADDWKAYTDSYYFPNYFEVNNYLKAAAPPHDGVVIGWGGSMSHLQSFKEGGALPALKQVCKQRPQVKVMIVGDKRVFDLLDIPDEQKIFRSYVPYDMWPNVVSEFDIGLAPLHGPYDARRSWIKPLEYSLLKIPWIASDNPAYEELREYGVLVRGSASAWTDAMLDMVDNLSAHRLRAIQEPYQFALQQGADKNVDNMLKIYTEILEKSRGNSYQQARPNLKSQVLSDFKNLPVLETKDVSMSEAAWRKNANRLRELVLNGDLDNFLNWDVILATMFVPDADYINQELKYLKNKSDWAARWKNAINESSVGNPLPYKTYPKSSGTLIHHAYHIAQFEEKNNIKINDFEYVLEFGGGYGSMCRLFYNLGFKGKYVIFDIPSFSALQKYYLKSLGLPVASNSEEFLKLKNGIYCVTNKDDLQNLVAQIKPEKSMFIATWSVSESQLSVRNDILPLIKNFRAFLIAYQSVFEDVDNIAFFDQWKNSVMNVDWHHWPIDQLAGSYYLTGTASTKA